MGCTTSSTATVKQSEEDRKVFKLKVYGFPASPPTRSVLALLEANAIPYELVVVNIFAGGQNTPEYRAVCVADDVILPSSLREALRCTHTRGRCNLAVESRWESTHSGGW